jgi:imidazolonepropionase-like amidohydrolase
MPGLSADLLLVDGDPLDDITLLHDQSRLHHIMVQGRTWKELS